MKYTEAPWIQMENWFMEQNIEIQWVSAKCSISIANALEILQSSNKPSTCFWSPSARSVSSPYVSLDIWISKLSSFYFHKSAYVEDIRCLKWLYLFKYKSKDILHADGYRCYLFSDFYFCISLSEIFCYNKINITEVLKVWQICQVQMIFDYNSMITKHVMRIGKCILQHESYHISGYVRTAVNGSYAFLTTLIARFMGPTWGPSGADRTQVGPMLAPWSLLSGFMTVMSHECHGVSNHRKLDCYSSIYSSQQKSKHQKDALPTICSGLYSMLFKLLPGSCRAREIGASLWTLV